MKIRSTRRSFRNPPTKLRPGLIWKWNDHLDTPALVRQVEAAGGVAKISGAGSLSGPGAGSLLVYHHDPESLDHLACLASLKEIRAPLGAQGVREDDELSARPPLSGPPSSVPPPAAATQRFAASCIMYQVPFRLVSMTAFQPLTE